MVIDSGMERLMTFEPRTGMNRLVTRRISLASVRQRSGRAGVRNREPVIASGRRRLKRP